ncbi:MAG TPA: AtpZ/AtpI family protein [Chitinophagaceae bacterium]|nr:AtpZ/AtpI family protein [Chitinophagaceae bacterium]
MQKQYPSRKRKPLRDIVRYSGLAFEMLAAIGIAVFAGIELDKWLKFHFPLFVLIFPLLAIGLILWNIIKSTE